jgi:hypothetical protein
MRARGEDRPRMDKVPEPQVAVLKSPLSSQPSHHTLLTSLRDPCGLWTGILCLNQRLPHAAARARAPCLSQPTDDGPARVRTPCRSRRPELDSVRLLGSAPLWKTLLLPSSTAALCLSQASVCVRTLSDGCYIEPGEGGWKPPRTTPRWYCTSHYFLPSKPCQTLGLPFRPCALVLLLLV